MHEFFNLFSVVIFLPLEIAFGLLEKIGKAMAGIFTVEDASMKGMNFVKAATMPVVNTFKDVAHNFGDTWGAFFSS